jgi:DNA-binding transcriptional LysR family regulator
MAVVYTHDLGGTNAWSFRGDGLETSIPISGCLRFNANEGVRAAVLGGLGFTIASQWMFAPEVPSGAVRAVLTEWTLPDIELWVVFPKGRMTNAKPALLQRSWNAQSAVLVLTRMATIATPSLIPKSRRPFGNH